MGSLIDLCHLASTWVVEGSADKTSGGPTNQRIRLNSMHNCVSSGHRRPHRLPCGLLRNLGRIVACERKKRSVAESAHRRLILECRDLVPQSLDPARRGIIGSNVNRYRHLLNELENRARSSLVERWTSATGLGCVKNGAPRKLQRKAFLHKPAPGAGGAY